MGLGKTFVGSEKAQALGDKVLLICQKSKIDDWIEHYREYYDYVIYNLRDKKQLSKYIEDERRNVVGIINYELVFRREELNKLKDFTIMLDESSYIKNNQAKRTKFIMKLNYKNVILLSGTPMGGGYEELYTQVKMLGAKINKTQFWRKYIKTYDIKVSGWKVPVIYGYKNIDELKDNIRELGAVFMETDEVIDLPDQMHNNVVVHNFSGYRAFNKNNYLEMNTEKVASKLKLKGKLPPVTEFVGDTVLTSMLYLRQLAGIYNPNKLEKTRDLINSTNKRIIIFYNFTLEFEQLKALCDELDRPVSYVNGSGRDLKAYEEENNSITLVQYQSGSQGLNLQKANITIYYSPTQSAEYFMQSKKRTHRMKQDKTCIYYYLITKDSIESKIYDALERGEDYTTYLFKEDIGDD